VYQKLEEIDSDDKFHTDTYDYQDIWETKGATLKNYITVYGYSDILLITADEGQVVYTGRKGSDLGMNLKVNFDSTNPLALVWKNVLETGTLQYQDFTPYKIEGGAPIAYIASPIFNLKKEIVAVIAMQISNQVINNIMGEHSGMMKTGESYLVGYDYLMRSDASQNSDKYSILNSFAGQNKAKSTVIDQALDGETGTVIGTNFLNHETLAAFTSIKFGDNTWALVSELDKQEAFQSVGPQLPRQ